MTLAKYRTPLNTIFNDFFNESAQENYRASFQPQINLSENDRSFEITLAIPGFKKEDIELELKDNRLSIRGEYKLKSSDTDKFHRNEISNGNFERAFKLPENVDIEKIEAKHEDGLLKILMTKKELNEQKKVIKIN